MLFRIATVGRQSRKRRFQPILGRYDRRRDLLALLDSDNNGTCASPNNQERRAIIARLRNEIRIQTRFRKIGHWAFRPDRMGRLLAALIVERRGLQSSG